MTVEQRGDPYFDALMCVTHGHKFGYCGAIAFVENMRYRREMLAEQLVRTAYYYGLPIVKGQRVRHGGKPGVILGADTGGMYVKVKYDDGSIERNLHPMWKMEYIKPDGTLYVSESFDDHGMPVRALAL